MNKMSKFFKENIYIIIIMVFTISLMIFFLIGRYIFDRSSIGSTGQKPISATNVVNNYAPEVVILKSEEKYEFDLDKIFKNSSVK